MSEVIKESKDKAWAPPVFPPSGRLPTLSRMGDR